MSEGEGSTQTGTGKLIAKSNQFIAQESKVPVAQSVAVTNKEEEAGTQSTDSQFGPEYVKFHGTVRPPQLQPPTPSEHPLDLEDLYKRIHTDEKLRFVAETVDFIASTIKQFNNEGLILSFNGGKDCTVLLHLLCVAIVHLYPEMKSRPLERIHVIYFPNPDEFPEIEAFMQQLCSFYSFSLCVLSGDFKAGLRELLLRDEFQDTRRAIFMGQRKGDPESCTLEKICPSDAGWPKFSRVFPILDWTYAEVWQCLLTLDLPYCSLYSRGYTSLGTIKDTQPNPALRRPIPDQDAHASTERWIYAHACDLVDSSLERAGRFNRRNTEANGKGNGGSGSSSVPVTQSVTASLKTDLAAKRVIRIATAESKLQGQQSVGSPGRKDYRTLWVNVLQQLGHVTIDACGPSHSHVVYSVTSSSSCDKLPPSTLLVGFSLGCNTSIAESLCRDKKLTHSLLSASGISVVEHKLIAGVKQINYNCMSSRWADVAAFFLTHKNDVVLKDTKGKAGSSVYRATTWKELELAFCKLQTTKPSLVITPFIPASYEIRVLVLPRMAKESEISTVHDFELFTPIVFRKVPLRVVGDGVSSLAQLATLHAPASSDIEALLASLGDAGARVLGEGEAWSSWMFNQTLGATFDRVSAEQERQVCEVALKAARTLGLWCCAVDVLMPQATVLELNTKVVTDILDVEQSEAAGLILHALRLGAVLRHHALKAAESIAQQFPSIQSLSSSITATSASPSSTTPSVHTDASIQSIATSALITDSATTSTSQSSNEQLASQQPSSSVQSLNPSGHAASYHQRTSVRRRLVEAAFAARGLDTMGYDEDYVLCSRRQSSYASHMFWSVNYDFGQLLSTESDVTKSKALTATLLHRANVPCIPHQVIYDPVTYEAKTSIASALQLLENSFPCVLKPDGGSGGLGVAVVDSVVAAETVLLKSSLSVSLSPFVKIKAEYRCICVGGQVMLSLIKRRPFVKADGIACVAELAARWAKSNARSLYPRLLEEWSKLAVGSSLWSVPPRDEEVLTTWKHNLDYGSTPVLCEAPSDVVVVAQRAASSLNLAFAAVDVVQSETSWKFLGSLSPESVSTWVLEVNSCPMWTQTTHHLPHVASACVQAVVDLVLQAPLTPPI